MSAPTAAVRADRPLAATLRLTDVPLLLTLLGVLAFGLVMVGSASIGVAEHQHGQPFYFLVRQAAYIGIGLIGAWGVVHVPMAVWQRSSTVLVTAGIVLLLLVLIPGVGRHVNGSARWLPLGPMQLQVSEPVKLGVVLYLAAYVARRAGTEIDLKALIEPMVVLAAISLLLLLEPDFGATVVMLATAVGMLFLGGCKWRHFVITIVALGVGLALIALLSPYRFQRLTAFLNPWSDPFASGFQLTQALIAFGRGEWLGVGLGDSVQKLFYLPEAHTDFLFAVLGEELGLAGVVAVIAAFGFIVWRAFRIADQAARAGRWYGAYVAYGVAMWMALQVVINVGVNMGVLPTKGLTLPLMSYGGSSIVVNCAAAALLLRVRYETRTAGAVKARRAAAW